VLGVRCWVLGGRRIADCGVSPEFPVGQEFFFQISEIGPSLFGLRSHCKGEGEDVRGPGVGCSVLGGRRIADCGVSPEFPVGREVFFKISETGACLFGLRSHFKGGGEEEGRGSGVEGRGREKTGFRCWVFGVGGRGGSRVQAKTWGAGCWVFGVRGGRDTRGSGIRDGGSGPLDLPICAHLWNLWMMIFSWHCSPPALCLCGELLFSDGSLRRKSRILRGPRGFFQDFRDRRLPFRAPLAF